MCGGVSCGVCPARFDIFSMKAIVFLAVAALALVSVAAVGRPGGMSDVRPINDYVASIFETADVKASIATSLGVEVTDVKAVAYQ